MKKLYETKLLDVPTFGVVLSNNQISKNSAIQQNRHIKMALICTLIVSDPTDSVEITKF